jgi:Ca2+/Na+ antiporter
MAEKLPQTYANHTRFHPLFHYFVAPGALVLIILAVIGVFRYPSQLEAWILLLMAVLFFAAVFLVRSYPRPCMRNMHLWEVASILQQICRRRSLRRNRSKIAGWRCIATLN